MQKTKRIKFAESEISRLQADMIYLLSYKKCGRKYIVAAKNLYTKCSKSTRNCKRHALDMHKYIML